jgi:Flp pilus assembly pilin Flp
MMKLWQDDDGIVALEYLLVATIVGLGLVVGLAAVEGALDSELTELANAILTLDQSYSFTGISIQGIAAKTGSSAQDVPHRLTPVAYTAVNQNIDVSPTP